MGSWVLDWFDAIVRWWGNCTLSEAMCGRPRNAPRGLRAAWISMSSLRQRRMFGAVDDVAAAGSSETPYMLGPLAEIAPKVVHPTAGLTIGELWQRFDRDVTR